MRFVMRFRCDFAAEIASQIACVNGPLHNAILDAISDAISRTTCASPYPARMLFFTKHRVDWKESYTDWLTDRPIDRPTDQSTEQVLLSFTMQSSTAVTNPLQWLCLQLLSQYYTSESTPVTATSSVAVFAVSLKKCCAASKKLTGTGSGGDGADQRLQLFHVAHVEHVGADGGGRHHLQLLLVDVAADADRQEVDRGAFELLHRLLEATDASSAPAVRDHHQYLHEGIVYLLNWSVCGRQVVGMVSGSSRYVVGMRSGPCGR